MEPEWGALDAGGVGGLVKVPGQLEVARDVVAEGEDHGERDQATLQLVELPVNANETPLQGDPSGRSKALLDFVLIVLAAGGPLLQLPTAQAG